MIVKRDRERASAGNNMNSVEDLDVFKPAHHSVQLKNPEGIILTF
jgi:hypothetical protein